MAAEDWYYDSDHFETVRVEDGNGERTDYVVIVEQITTFTVRRA